MFESFQRKKKGTNREKKKHKPKLNEQWLVSEVATVT